MSWGDIRFILANPFVYRLFSTIVGQGSARQVYVNEYIKPEAGNRILDIGCGPADILEYLPEYIEYIGFDMSAEYIEAARKRFGHRGRFICQLLSLKIIEQMELFDLVIAIGVLHHLDNTHAENLFTLAQKALKPGGRLITIDPVFYSGQSRWERYLISKDRGEFVRSEQEYRSLIPQGFSANKTVIRRGLLRMPYSLMFMECCK
ncbi:MAG: class I SAM-dependent methyltransferase [Syntrophomonas sp.]|uniref:Class I SAM-dependent methyltransferase n=1 Tax=Syntrophomonas wolfei TaxID=863 RepID=A0A354YW54_9FIRM|nr:MULTISPECIES: class I SAM-dependent methyltransferase [Syntrophomonas]MDD2511285.1 class I SAM-dependent methyltransferase [Syntrophomonas sp.]MDD3879100.1 class I SAM-dependent methyltransferase [Syntrophomonas sp.]MDD4626599.1 class I SAM-dependent methyltransferase [Syntrophomonas sp.]HBK52931.1 class I SAM-dependent methyltransferase [Syntrophomonas wolfei]